MLRTLATAAIAALCAVGLVYGVSFVLAVHPVPTDSMAPTIEPGDHVIVIETGDHQDLPVGEIVLYRANGDGDLIVHRIVDRASQPDCETDGACPPDGEYLTAGDANPRTDQAMGISDPVRPEWIVGTVVWPRDGR